jgi:hypothetical protein
MGIHESSYEAPAVEREIAPEELSREGHYAGTVISDPPR